jgi:hypothetical protein
LEKIVETIFSDLDSVFGGKKRGFCHLLRDVATPRPAIF